MTKTDFQPANTKDNDNNDDDGNDQEEKEEDDDEEKEQDKDNNNDNNILFCISGWFLCVGHTAWAQFPSEYRWGTIVFLILIMFQLETFKFIKLHFIHVWFPDLK